MPASLLDSQLAALQCEEEELLLHVTAGDKQAGEGSCGGGGSSGGCREGNAEEEEFPSVQQIVESIIQRLQGSTV
jgi:hypothetical protein